MESEFSRGIVIHARETRVGSCGNKLRWELLSCLGRRAAAPLRGKRFLLGASKVVSLLRGGRGRSRAARRYHAGGISAQVKQETSCFRYRRERERGGGGVR